MHNAFSVVKNALPAQAAKILAEYNVKHNKPGSKLEGEWTAGFLCPFCGDQSGSASFTPQLFLKCHQCGTKADVFDWLSRYTGQTPWDLCQELAQRLGCQLPKGKRINTRSMPVRMTEEIWLVAMEDLWRHKDAAPARAILEERKLTDQLLAADLGVGWIRGSIIFVNRTEKGQLHERYRGWNPSNAKLKWMWHGVGLGGPGIWPPVEPAEDAKILLLEGESDVLTAWMRLRLHEQGWHPCTWTAGATSSPKARDVPSWMQGREVHIGYDNDVFQGSDYAAYYVEAKPGKSLDAARLSLEQRLRNLLDRLAPLLQSLRCDVTLRKCPVDPKVKYGGDFRDWVDAGGVNLDDWEAFRFEDLPTFGVQVLDVPFGDVYTNLHRKVRTTVQVESVARDDVILSTSFKMECEMGQHPVCAFCPGARLFPDGMIDMLDYPRELAVGLEQMQVTDKIIKDIVQKPKGCPRCEVVSVQNDRGSEWKCMPTGATYGASQMVLHVFSREAPSLSGEMEIEGTPYPNARGNGVVLLADQVKPLDRAEVDLEPHLQELRNRTPCYSDRLEDFDTYLDERHRDLSYNVTKIYGRRDIHIAHDLLAHSVRRAQLFGSVQRAWLDVCVFGDTRTGKSLTFRRMMEFHGLGVHHTAVSNMSRAGIIMGASKDGMLKPGMMPRNHGKMAMIDELHFLVANSMEHPMSWLQSVRDDGVASGVKIYGDRDLPAEVRLVCIANWMRNRKGTYQFPCEHLLALYGAPETLARLDFGLAVQGRPDQLQLDRTAQWWTRERVRALILRAWAQDPSQVIIDPEAMELAREQCKQWDGIYDAANLPLFTPEEKPNSILRIAIALANLTFSHPGSNPYAVHVRASHAEWACIWLEKTWKLSQYDAYSLKKREHHQVIKPFEVEKNLVLRIGLEDPTVAVGGLSELLTPFTIGEVGSLTGLENFAATAWINRMVALHVFERVRDRNAWTVKFQPTVGGQLFLQNLIRIAETDERQWFDRVRALQNWTAKGDPPGLAPMNQDTWNLELGEAGGDTPF